MKKFKNTFILIAILVVMLLCTGCGVEDPTKEDVENALISAGILPGDDEEALLTEAAGATITIGASDIQTGEVSDQTTGDGSGDVEDSDTSGDTEASDDTETSGDAETPGDAETAGDSNTTDADTAKAEKAKVEIEYSVRIDSIEVDDDKTATVMVTVIEVEGPVQRTSTYELKFKYKNDKWQPTEITAVTTAADNGIELVGEISDKEISNILSENMMGVTMPDDSYINWANVSSITIEDHELDSESMTDTVTIEVVGKSDFFEYSFAMIVEFIYRFVETGSDENGWEYNYYYDVLDDYTYDYCNEYKFALTTEQIAKQLKNSSITVYAVGAYYSFSDAEVTSVEYNDVEPDGSKYAETSATIAFTYEDVSIELDCTLEFYFDASSWSLYGVYDQSLVSYSCAATGQWSGFDNNKNTVTFEITKELNDYGYPKVMVVVTSEDNGSYSWEAYLDKYKIGEESTAMQIYFTDWISMPTDENYYGYDNFSGVLSGKSFAPEESWYSWSFTKG